VLCLLRRVSSCVVVCLPSESGPLNVSAVTFLCSFSCCARFVGKKTALVVWPCLV
jgi:hypothetical protein